jgi:hypothetical protein
LRKAALSVYPLEELKGVTDEMIHDSFRCAMTGRDFQNVSDAFKLKEKIKAYGADNFPIPTPYSNLEYIKGLHNCPTDEVYMAFLRKIATSVYSAEELKVVTDKTIQNTFHSAMTAQELRDVAE